MFICWGFAFLYIMREKEKETWKDVPGYEGYYQVSDIGRVRSLDRNIVYVDGKRRLIKGRIIIGSAQKGYKITTLRGRGCGRSFKFSQLVAMAFLNHKPNGMKVVVDHINGDRSDDRVKNLRIVTNRENCSNLFRRDRANLSSRYTGVSWSIKDNAWRVGIHYDKITYNLGAYATELKASDVYQEALDKIKDGTFNPNDYKHNFSSKYKGVTFDKYSNKWIAQAIINKKRKYIGIYKDEESAHKAYQSYKNAIK